MLGVSTEVDEDTCGRVCVVDCRGLDLLGYFHRNPYSPKAPDDWEARGVLLEIVYGRRLYHLAVRVQQEEQVCGFFFEVVGVGSCNESGHVFISSRVLENQEHEASAAPGDRAVS